MALKIGFSATQDFATGFPRSELQINGKIYTSVTACNWSQPTERAAVKGTQSEPIDQTVGTMDLGELTVTFSDEKERTRMFTDLGNAYREKKVPILWMPGGPKSGTKYEFDECVCTDDPGDHGEGAEALGGDVAFSFRKYRRNGLSAHSSPAGSGGIGGAVGGGGASFGI
jgi:hypothetical protein